MAIKPASGGQGVCPTCKGARTVKVKGGEVKPCPACGGTGNRGLVTK